MEEGGQPLAETVEVGDDDVTRVVTLRPTPAAQVAVPAAAKRMEVTPTSIITSTQCEGGRGVVGLVYTLAIVRSYGWRLGGLR